MRNFYRFLTLVPLGGGALWYLNDPTRRETFPLSSLLRIPIGPEKGESEQDPAWRRFLRNFPIIFTVTNDGQTPIPSQDLAETRDPHLAVQPEPIDPIVPAEGDDEDDIVFEDDPVPEPNAPVEEESSDEDTEEDSVDPDELAAAELVAASLVALALEAADSDVSAAGPSTSGQSGVASTSGSGQGSSKTSTSQTQDPEKKQPRGSRDGSPRGAK